MSLLSDFGDPWCYFVSFSGVGRESVMAQVHWHKVSVLVVNGHRFAVHPRNGDECSYNGEHLSYGTL